MGLESPKRLEQVKQIKPSPLLSESQIFLESGNHHKTTVWQKRLQAGYHRATKKLSRVLSINYVSAMSIYRACIYAAPYFATGFHRRSVIAPDATATREKKATPRQQIQLPALLAEFTCQQQPHHSVVGGLYIVAATICQRESVSRQCKFQIY